MIICIFCKYGFIRTHQYEFLQMKSLLLLRFENGWAVFPCCFVPTNENSMKTTSFLTVIFIAFSMQLFGQNSKLAVVGFDVQVAELKSHNLTELLRIELSKHNRYEISDRYEVAEVLNNNDMEITSCLSKSCLLKAGELLEVNKVVSGSIDKMGESIFIRLRIIDVKSKSIEKEVVKQFLMIPEKISPMLSISVNELMGVANDKSIENSLTSKNSYESAINNPQYARLELSGPRMGYTFLTGEAAGIMRKSVSQGGYDAYPALFQFGYQFERQYLNEGKFQALFEIIPMVSGLDQGLFIPSLTVMNGLRNNVNGVEFAIGPSFNIVKMDEMFKDPEYGWLRTMDHENFNGYDEVMRMDSRGRLSLRSYVVIAAGFSLRSGKMNIPINAFAIPSKNSFRCGFSFGFNAKG